MLPMKPYCLLYKQTYCFPPVPQLRMYGAASIETVRHLGKSVNLIKNDSSACKRKCV